MVRHPTQTHPSNQLPQLPKINPKLDLQPLFIKIAFFLNFSFIFEQSHQNCSTLEKHGHFFYHLKNYGKWECFVCFL